MASRLGLPLQQQQQQQQQRGRSGTTAGRRRTSRGAGLGILLAAAAGCLIIWLQLSARLAALAPDAAARASVAGGEEAATAAAAYGRSSSPHLRHVDDQLLQRVVQQCMQRDETFISILPQQRSTTAEAAAAAAAGARVAVWRSAPQQQPPHAWCPLLHIPLAPGDRSIGLCTDAALYVLLLGAVVSPAGAPGLDAARACGAASGVLFLEPLYDAWAEWLLAASGRHVVAAYAPNFEHVFGFDAPAHARMQLVLCKVRRCEELFARHLRATGSNATLVYTGHTSLDPHAIVQQQQQQEGHDAGPDLAAGVQPVAALHVRGKSGLKHSKQLLDCWLRHPEWPPLTFVGPLPNEQVSLAQARQALAAPNIRVPQPGRARGPGWPEFVPLPAASLAALQLASPLHVMPSEREGFGHAINEARAAGAVALVPDHPPMNELVRRGAGVLLRPARAFSHREPPVPLLGRYGNISVSMASEDICAGVEAALRLSRQELLEMGTRARALFQADRADFEERLADVRVVIRSRVA